MAASLAPDDDDSPIAPRSNGGSVNIPGHDPFVTRPAPTGAPPHHFRFSTFDHHFFALGPGSSPEQARRALDAHLAEIDRRIQEVGQLGTTLVHQRNEIVDRRADVDKITAEGELGSHLRQKLQEIEKDFNDVERETARALLPKRVPSGEANSGSPYFPEGRGGRRSVSPSKLESFATGSPTKLGIPNRKMRNQPSARIHDIEFAAEISTSLIAQVRSLQALLSEREEELREARSDNSRLEMETETFQERVRSLDENETRYKDENWDLETQVHGLVANQREADDREKKLHQTLNLVKAEKNETQRELDDIKMAHARLVEDHEADRKHHDVELGAAKRAIEKLDVEKSCLSAKLDELTSQNLELAKALSLQRSRALEGDAASGVGEDNSETAAERPTPDPSPPASPVKGQTPRHAMLETETLRSSFYHAQRQLQNQRSLLHREKTEKLELKRLLQETRDELERARNDAGLAAPANRRGRKPEPREFKKPPPRSLLGAARVVKTEIIEHDDEPDWEDQIDSTPSRPPRTARDLFGRDLLSQDLLSRDLINRDIPLPSTESDDHFETANETSDAAFETAHEHGTETEDFQTGAEEISSDDAPTETESPSKNLFGKIKRAPSLPMRSASFHSTASTSNDDDDNDNNDDDDDEREFGELRTPTSVPPARLRMRPSRGYLGRRGSRQGSDDLSQGSPASFATSSVTATPEQRAGGHVGGQSLFAELADFDGSDNESVGVASNRSRSRGVTPASSLRAATPASVMGGGVSLRQPLMPPMPRLLMVDSGVMTDPIKIMSLDDGLDSAAAITCLSGAGHDDRRRMPNMPSMSMAMASVTGPDAKPLTQSRDSVAETDCSRPMSTFSYSDAGAQWDHAVDVSTFPIPPFYLAHAPPPPPALALSPVLSEGIEPVAGPAPELRLSPISAESVEPIPHPEPVAPLLVLSAVESEQVEPRAEPVSPPKLALSRIASEHVEPEPEVVVPALPPPPAPTLAMSIISSEQVEPEPEPEPEPRIIMVPVPAREPTLSPIQSENVKPVEEPEIISPPPAHATTLAMSPVHCEEIVPVQEPEKPEIAPVPPPLPALALSAVLSQDLAPVEEPTAAPVPATTPLSFSQVVSEQFEPFAEPAPEPAPKSMLPPLTLAGISKQLRPESEYEPVARQFTFSPIAAIETSPQSLRSPKRDAFMLPRDAEPAEPAAPAKPKPSGMFGSMLQWARGQQEETPDTLAVEHETRQSPESPRGALHDISGKNTNGRVPHRPVMTDQTSQTTLTSDAIDKLLGSSHQQPPRLEFGHERMSSITSIASDMASQGTQGTQGTVRRRTSQESMQPPPLRPKGKAADASIAAAASDGLMLRGRSGSVSNHRPTPSQDLPPLPANHRQAIEAARTESSAGYSPNVSPNPNMGPPPSWPASASAMRHRPRTPSTTRPMSPQSARNMATPRAAPNVVKAASVHGGHAHVNAHVTSHVTSRLGAPLCRRSSVSSFASEIESRFNMNPADMPMDPNGFAPNTDPRMIQAITQTMIGEYLWKYTRKTGRDQMSENRHRRYFWVHPYTRTLYWSDRDPSTAGRAELKAKSVLIEAVHAVADDNPMPPGLHRKSLVIVSPGRMVKFTCTTGQRHETWFNALSYLLLRTSAETRTDAEEMATGLAGEDTDDFSPAFARQPPPASMNRPRGPASLSSYNSRTTRNESPAVDMSMNIPTLAPSPTKTRPNDYDGQQPDVAPGSALRPSLTSRISGYWKSTPLSGTLSTLRGRSAVSTTHSVTSARSTHSTHANGIYEASEVHDSGDDLHHIHEEHDLDSFQVENVRACCEGKHDVGTLSHTSSSGGRRSRSRHHSHSRGISSRATTPMGTIRSRT